MEPWFDEFPAGVDKAELRGRFRNTGALQHQSAFFELLLHELLRRLGCELQPHPDIPGVSTHPEFLVRSADAGTWYTEATVASDQPEDQVAARKRYEVLGGVLDGMEDLPYSLISNLRRLGTGNLPGKRIRAELRAFLGTLAPDEIDRRSRSRGLLDPIMWRFNDEDWDIIFSIIPEDLVPNRVVVAEVSGVQAIDPSSAFKEKVAAKGKRYGPLEQPYVIAVNAISVFVARDDVVEALFGAEKTDVTLTGFGTAREQEVRSPDVWTSSAGPVYRRISAVLACIGLSPWRLADRPVCLYLNPWAEHPYDGQLCQLPRAVVEASMSRLEMVLTRPASQSGS
jgi:hypothetical protein